jgi:DNA-binding transcriptional MerR regulator/methylmalonyl-CoA mutase cobalamin-binding subunit
MKKSIKEVEKETNISVEVLRQWERRYGFPNPIRNAAGDRRYSTAHINKLKIIKALIDSGERPGKILTMNLYQLEKLSSTNREILPVEKRILLLLRSQDILKLEVFVKNYILEIGLMSFLTETLPLWNFWIGEAWNSGGIKIFEEHLYTETMIRIVRLILNEVKIDQIESPQIMLTTVSGENHTLGILIVEGLLRLKNISVLNLGIEMPIEDIANAAQKYNLKVVGLSFSIEYNLDKAISEIRYLRKILPTNTTLWIGGKLFENSRMKMSGVVIPKSLHQLPISELLSARV